MDRDFLCFFYITNFQINKRPHAILFPKLCTSFQVETACSISAGMITQTIHRVSESNTLPSSPDIHSVLVHKLLKLIPKCYLLILRHTRKFSACFLIYILYSLKFNLKTSSRTIIYYCSSFLWCKKAKYGKITTICRLK